MTGPSDRYKAAEVTLKPSSILLLCFDVIVYLERCQFCDNVMVKICIPRLCPGTCDSLTYCSWRLRLRPAKIISLSRGGRVMEDHTVPRKLAGRYEVRQILGQGGMGLV